MFGSKGKKETEQPNLFFMPTVLPDDKATPVRPDDTAHLDAYGKRKKVTRRAANPLTKVLLPDGRWVAHGTKDEVRLTLREWLVQHGIVNDDAITGQPVNPDKIKRSKHEGKRPVRKNQPTVLTAAQSRDKNSHLNALPPKIGGVDKANLGRLASMVKNILKTK